MTPRDTIYDTFDRWVTIRDKTAIDVICSTVIANRLPGQPLYLILLAPSSAGKSILIDSLRELKDVHPLSKLSDKTLFSGFKQKKSGLLERLDPSQTWILTFKDFTTILAQPRQIRDAILAQFREIYDGSFTGEWGSGKSFVWKGKIGLILGCTGAWEEIGSEFGVLGERFVLYRMAERGGIPQAERATRGSATHHDMERSLRA